MVMVADLVPGLKRFVRVLTRKESVRQMVYRMILTFVLHSGRMSCLQAAGGVRSHTVHRAQVGRALRRRNFRRMNILSVLMHVLLGQDIGKGLFIFIIDGTLCSQAGTKTENTYSTGNRRRRPAKGRRYGKQKHTAKSCHSFTMGLLITPGGIRIPIARPHYTREYCQQQDLEHKTTAEMAAEMIRQLPLPPEVQVVVLGDTAYDADAVRAACQERGYEWIFPCNPERVLAGKKPRPRVRSLLKNWSSWSLQTIRFCPGEGPYVAYRRLSPYRVGPKAKRRTFYVHQERRAVHSVGKVSLVFSTTKAQLAKATADDVKILMTNAMRRSVREIVELYLLRWQIELFFKELKSTLGFHQYQFERFTAVESWMELALATFMYLEWYRAEQLARRSLSDKNKKWWRHQRTHGLCQAIRLAVQQAEIQYLADSLETRGGITRLKRLVRASFAPEYRAAS